MQMLDELLKAGAAQSLARDTGVDPQTAQTGLAALLPAVLGGMQNHGQAHPQGLGGLAGMLGGLGGGGLFDQAVSPQPTPVEPGNQVLGSIFGSKDTSLAVATHAAQQSGLSPDLLKKMLPIVAMLAAGYFAKQAGGGQGSAIGGGGMGGMLGSLLGGAMGSGAAGGGNPLGQILGGLMGAGRH
jgi:hypothetical protein